MLCKLRLPSIQSIKKQRWEDHNPQVFEQAWDNNDYIHLGRNVIVYSDRQTITHCDAVSGAIETFFKRNYNETRRRFNSVEIPIGVKISQVRNNLCITSNCNLSCSYCFIPDNVKNSNKSLSLSQINTSLREGLPISLYGGEPFIFLRDNHAIIAQLPRGTVVVTNGTVIDRQVIQKLCSGGCHIAVTLSSCLPEFLACLPRQSVWTALVTISKENISCLDKFKTLIWQYKPNIVSLNMDYNLMFSHNLDDIKNKIGTFLALSGSPTLTIKPYFSVFSPSFCPYCSGAAKNITVEGKTCYCQAIISSEDPRFADFCTPPDAFYSDSLFTGCPYYSNTIEHRWNKIKKMEVELLLQTMNS